MNFVWNCSRTCTFHGYSQWSTQSTGSDITSNLEIEQSVAEHCSDILKCKCEVWFLGQHCLYTHKQILRLILIYFDEGKYFLTHILDDLLEKSPGRKSTGNSKPTTKRSLGAVATVSSQCWQRVQVYSKRPQ